MTNEEAIDVIYDIKTDAVYNILLNEKEALDKAIKALEQRGCVWEIAYERGKFEVLDKIRAEIQRLRNCSCSCSDGIIDDVEDIIDKYRAESGDKK